MKDYNKLRKRSKELAMIRLAIDSNISAIKSWLSAPDEIKPFIAEASSEMAKANFEKAKQTSWHIFGLNGKVDKRRQRRFNRKLRRRTTTVNINGIQLQNFNCIPLFDIKTP